MSRHRRTPRWTATALLVTAVGLAAAGCIAVPVGGYGGGYGEPGIAFPAPGIVIAPPPVVFGGGHYGGRPSRYGRGYGYGSRGHRGWRG